MKKKIAVLPGDGVGPEVVNQALKVIESVNERFGHDMELIHADFGAVSIEEHGEPLTEETLKICLNSDAVLLGAIGHPKFDQNPDATIRPEQGLLQLRKALELHTNVRPIRTYRSTYEVSPVKNSLLQDVDFVIFRELTGGLYFGEKTLDAEGNVASDSCTYSRKEIIRIAAKAFETARERKGRITLVDKANVLETSRLWRRVIQDMNPAFPDVAVDFLYVDNAAMQLMLRPSQFDVILTENLFGDILSDLAGVLAGSIGLLPSASIGDKYALFEPIHGSYPQAASKDTANPIGTILSVAMMYEHFDAKAEADAIREAVNWSLTNGIYTPDIRETDSTWCSQVGDSIALFIERSDVKNAFSFNRSPGVFI